MGDGDGLLAAAVAIGGGLLLWKLLSSGDEKTAETAGAAGSGVSSSPAPSDPSLPQERPGAADAGSGFDVYAFPPGTTPRDVADWFASQGNAHDAGAYLNETQNLGVVPQGAGGSLPPERKPHPTNIGGGGPVGPPPRPEPTGGTITVPYVGGTPLDTHEDILGRTQPGPPSEAEVVSKLALPLAASAAAVDVGATLIKNAPAAVKVSRPLAQLPTTIREMGKARALGGPVTVGLGIGLTSTQILQETGFFDKMVKPAGAATSKLLGPTESKRIATAVLPLSMTGGAIKAVVTPGESVVGNVKRAVQASAVPDAIQAIRNAPDKTRANIQQAHSNVSSFLSRWF